MHILWGLFVSLAIDFGMFAMGMLLFRIPLQGKFKMIVIASITSASLSWIIHYVLDWDLIQPLLFVLIHALQIYYMLRISKIQAIILSFMGCLSHTVLLAVVMFIFVWHAGYSYEYLFYNNEIEVVVKTATLALHVLLCYLLERNRWGFTFISGYGNHKSYWKSQRKLSLVLLGSFFVFSFAYYAVTLHISLLLWIAIGFFILLGAILYLLYKKEMEDP
ncbi:hypothetical protein D3C73_876630 [compost metagenome]